jgi:ferrous iron transport protein B
MNMMDGVEAKGYKIDIQAISREMGVPVVPMIANRNKGTGELLQEIVRVADKEEKANGVKIDYGREVESQISRLEEAISASSMAREYSPRWLAVKLIEGDSEIISKFEEVKNVK